MHWSPLPIPWYIQFPYARPSPDQPPPSPPSPPHRFVDQVLPLLKAQRLLAALTLLQTQQPDGGSPRASVLVSALRSLGAAGLMRDAEAIASGLGVQLVRIVWKCGISAVCVRDVDPVKGLRGRTTEYGPNLVSVAWAESNT